MFVDSILAALLTVNDIVAQHPVTGTPPHDFVWSPNGSRYAYSVNDAGSDAAPTLYVHDMRTNRDYPLLRATSAVRGSRSRAVSQVVWSNDGSHLAFVDNGALHVARADGSAERIVAGDADDPQWSPDGERIAYITGNDLLVASVSTVARPVRLTTTGSATRINGDPDWLYSEEMGVEHAYRWSPDGASIAYLSFDESPVTPYPIQNFLTTVNTVEEQRYPLAGGRNPNVSLHVVSSHGGGERRLYDGAPKDEYVVSFTWMPDSKGVVDEIVDRPQRHLRLEYLPRNGAASRTLAGDSDAHFVDVVPPPIFARDGKTFYWLSPRGGVQALYRVDTATGKQRRLTGAYAVVSIERIDDERGLAYVTAQYPTRRDRSLLAVSLKGRATRDVTPGSGSHAVALPERGQSYVEVDSSRNVAPAIERRSLDSNARITLFRTPDLSRFALPSYQFVTVLSKWGPLDAALLLPSGFDPTKKYPAIVSTYGGPLGVDWGEAADAWRGLYDQLLAQRGYVVFSIDGPASNSDRAANSRLFASQLGPIAMQGQLTGADWLKRQPYVDGSRVGLWGWSFGGYLTAFTLTHAPGVFASGIAGAPPSDWRFYDTAYTERYMGTPQRNATAYRDSSVLPMASRLRARLLILHGTSDDNVHLANSIALLQSFIRAGRLVEFYAFPGARHGPRTVVQRRDLDNRMLQWWDRTLGKP